MAANSALFEALYALEREKNISKDYMLEKIKTALVTAVKRENAVVEIDETKKTFRVFYMMNVVEEVMDPETEMTLDQARIYSKRATIGSTVHISHSHKKIVLAFHFHYLVAVVFIFEYNCFNLTAYSFHIITSCEYTSII